MKSTAKLSAILLAAATCLAWPVMAQTDSTPPATNTAPAAPRPPRAAGFRGTVASVDAPTMVLKLKPLRGQTNETIVKVTSSTKIFKDGQPGEFSDAVEGVRVSGSGKKAVDGSWTANTLRIMTKPPTRKTPPAAAAGQ